MRLDADDIAQPHLTRTLRPLLATNPVKVQYQLQSMTEDGTQVDSVFPSYKPTYDSEQMRHDNLRLGFYVCAPTSGNVFERAYLERLKELSVLDTREAFDGVPALIAPYYGDVISLNQPLARPLSFSPELSTIRWIAPPVARGCAGSSRL